MDVAVRMRELMEFLREEGFKGIIFPDLQVSENESWSEDWSLVSNLAYDNTFEDDYESADFQDEFIRFAEDWFEQLDDEIVVSVYWADKEIEAYRP